ncbi:MAG: OmpA family protein [Nitrospiraceae bacterium]|nr:MAG: OmpA family protein [Nitrospiraceae bacterium]
MRKIIIGISVLLYAVSGIITYRALVIPAGSSHYLNNPEGQGAKNLAPEPVAVNAAPAPTEPAVPEKETIVLAVLGSDTSLSDQVLIDDKLINSVTELVPKIQAYPGHRVIIEGHIDSVSGKMHASNQYGGKLDLSYLRAKAVAGILTEHGIPVERISVIGYSDTRPIAPNDTEEGRTKNRRVEIKLVPGDKES